MSGPGGTGVPTIQATDAEARLDELDGFMIEFDDTEDETEQDAEPGGVESTDPEPVGPPR